MKLITLEDYLENNTNNLVVIYPGRFQPAHKNHAKVYNFLTTKFNYADVYIATSNKILLPKSPFTFDEKKIMLQAAGVPADKIIQTANPYQSREILQKYDSTSTCVIFAVGAKDMDPVTPRFNFLPTKKGDAYFKPLPTLNSLTAKAIQTLYTLDKHGYVATIPTYRFTINIVGKNIPILGASQIRDLYRSASILGKKEIIKQLYGSYNENIYNIFENRLI